MGESNHMHTKMLMSFSALFLAALGILALFLTQRILLHYGAYPGTFAVIILKVVGGVLLGFAVLNWTARAALGGGASGRPLALGNFVHFALVTLALWRPVVAHAAGGYKFITITVLYTIFAVWFAVVLFSKPNPDKPSSPA